MTGSSPGESPDSSPDSGRPAEGLTMMDVVALPDEQRQLITWMLRHGEVNLSAVSQQLAKSAEQGQAILLELEAKGFIQEVSADGEIRYRSRVGQRRNRSVGGAIWSALDEK